MPLTRRWLLQAGLAAGASAVPGLAHAVPPPHSHFPFGPVQPVRRVGAFKVLTHDGKAVDLPTLLRGKTTALQLMFTGCRGNCPIQGALFAQAQAAAARSRLPVQFVSLSIDALADTPQRLQAWLQQFGAQAGWMAAVPAVVRDVDSITALLGAGGQGTLSDRDPHSGQVHLLNRQADLVYRTPLTPSASDIVKALQQVLERFG
jgi:protein SCO1/2